MNCLSRTAGLGLLAGLLAIHTIFLPADAAPNPNRKILYYRNPMGLPDTSPVPKQDSMGMDYVPVYADEASTPGQVNLTPEKIQKLGVRTEAVRRMVFTQTVRAVGLLAPDERRQVIVAPRFEGWIEQLYADSTGQSVRRGDPLARIYSPELIWAQREYQRAVVAKMDQVAETVLTRLRNWQVPDDQIEQLRRIDTTDTSPRVLLRAPADGVVMEKTAVTGMRFMAGETLYRLADLSKLWLYAEVFERDLARIHPGQAAQITVNAYPGETFTGIVTFIYPTLDPQTRTVKVRIELTNTGGRLKPAMYASVEFATGSGGSPVLAIPASAVLESGTRQVAFVESAEGRFEPRNVKIGRRGEDMVEVRDGLHEGERVVISANFLIDAESNLKAALDHFGEQDAKPQSSPPEDEEHKVSVPSAHPHGSH